MVGLFEHEPSQLPPLEYTEKGRLSLGLSNQVQYSKIAIIACSQVPIAPRCGDAVVRGQLHPTPPCCDWGLNPLPRVYEPNVLTAEPQTVHSTHIVKSFMSLQPFCKQVYLIQEIDRKLEQ